MGRVFKTYIGLNAWVEFSKLSQIWAKIEDAIDL